jgi:hypothetical protein
LSVSLSFKTLVPGGLHNQMGKTIPKTLEVDTCFSVFAFAIAYAFAIASAYAFFRLGLLSSRDPLPPTVSGRQRCPQKGEHFSCLALSCLVYCLSLM